MNPTTPHPYNGLNYGHALYGVDSIGTVEPSVITDDTQCPATDSNSVLDELFCFMRRFVDSLKIRRLA